MPRVAYAIFDVVLIVLAWLARGQETKQSFIDWGAPKSLISTAHSAVILILGVAFIANVAGYVVLGKHLTQGIIDSIAVFLILFAGFSSISEIIHIVLGLPALDSFRSIAANRYRLQRVLKKPLVWLSLILWAWATLIAFRIDDWVIGSVQSVFQAEMSLGDVTLSLRGIFVFVFAIWLAVWTSRMVRAVLNQDVLPRMDLPRGVPNTISMTAHYSIIMIGLLLGVSFMGLDLSNLAFVVGALGVGIGFGLQNVVNNFVSGLILIFEAPIQVGDTVEVGTLMGQVTQIGIRTSRVRTYSGSEVIVPNGDLVSNQVVNWTLSDRRRRLQLAVGVAYGTDPNLVTEVLNGVLEADEEVLDDPAPLIVFNEFGDSSLNFDIYAWIGDFDIGFSTTHRLNTAINAALADAGITIPFPQRDLHLISTPESG
jgi:small-conductance mechanosensitive channel